MLDSALAVAQAVAMATMVGAFLSFAQERLLGRYLEGAAALAVNVAASLLVGIASVAQVGGFTIGVPPSPDPFSVAQYVLGVAIVVAVASKAAFEVLTKPILKRIG